MFFETTDMETLEHWAALIRACGIPVQIETSCGQSRPGGDPETDAGVEAFAACRRGVSGLVVDREHPRWEIDHWRLSQAVAEMDRAYPGWGLFETPERERERADCLRAHLTQYYWETLGDSPPSAHGQPEVSGRRQLAR